MTTSDHSGNRQRASVGGEDPAAARPGREAIAEQQRGQSYLKPEEVEARVRHFLPKRLKQFPFRIDMALQDPRPLNVLQMGDRQIYVYDERKNEVTAEPLTELLKYLPGKVAQCRIFAMTHEHDAALATALERALTEEPASIVTNV